VTSKHKNTNTLKIQK